MNYLGLKDLKRYKDFLLLEEGDINVVFSTAEEGKSYNRHTDDGIEMLNLLKDDFDVEEIQYLNQVHSSDVLIYKHGDEKFKDNEGDAIVTKEKSVIIGAFTADCVPIIIVDEKSKTVAAVHSGWKGTFNSIVKNTLLEMENKYDVKVNDVKVFIGPHIRQCCYEVSEELKDKFIEKTKINEDELFEGRNLSMEKCIEKDLLDCGVNSEKIYSINLCTHCEENIKLHSYRKSNGSYGRLFSFVYIK